MERPESNSPELGEPPEGSVKILPPAVVIPANIWEITGALAAAKPGAHRQGQASAPAHREAGTRC